MKELILRNAKVHARVVRESFPSLVIYDVCAIKLVRPL